MNDEPVVIRVGDAPTEDELLVEQELEELLDEVKEESDDQAYQRQVCRKLWPNFWRSWTRGPRKEYMRYRFQKLAGIIGDKTLASLTLPNGSKIKFTELPPWYDVLRYKICGFKYETYL
jgi:hypothetical protein